MSTNSVMLQITKGLQTIPLIGGFIPDYTHNTPSVSEVRNMINKAYRHLDELSSQERVKLSQITDQLEDYGQVIGSPSLMAFARSRRDELKQRASGIEQKINSIDNEKIMLNSRADDVISARGTSDQFKDSQTFKDFEQSVNDANSRT